LPGRLPGELTGFFQKKQNRLEGRDAWKLGS
jgi:hypothetical protein